ncbi:copper homeostasis membrane protein CopD [Oryzifoliimicrobium ureilyticus]|uniref:copper homeostasis membrane protein CopD n=1 Tax=Oryzifoliimicrobium ureilyticus TaxID=3113724 RepID=UPI00307645A6
MIGPETAIIGCRWLFAAAALFLWGAAAYLSVLVPNDLSRRVWTHLSKVRTVALPILIFATLAGLASQAANIGGGWGDGLRPDMLWDVLTDTNLGPAFLLQIFALALLLVSLRLSASRQIYVTAFGSASMLISLSLTGHAVMNDGWIAIAHQANDVLHVLSGGAWIGSLLPVFIILRTTRGSDHAAKTALTRFSTAGHFAVALVLATGVINLFLVLGFLPLRWSSQYQLLLCLKIALVLMMVGLAVANRYVFVAKMVEQNWAKRALIFGTLTEILIAGFVIGLVAWFGTLPPE